MDIEETLKFNWEKISVTFENINLVSKSVPRKPGIYNISTDTPSTVLAKYGDRDDAKHYNLKKKIKATDTLPDEYKILQENYGEYIVYNGHNHNLRQRLIEHFRGTNGTGCLALFRLEELREYKWYFSYLDLSIVHDYKDNKLIRSFLEQKYRNMIGWPILCSQ